MITQLGSYVIPMILYVTDVIDDFTACSYHIMIPDPMPKFILFAKRDSSFLFAKRFEFNSICNYEVDIKFLYLVAIGP